MCESVMASTFIAERANAIEGMSPVASRKACVFGSRDMGRRGCGDAAGPSSAARGGMLCQAHRNDSPANRPFGVDLPEIFAAGGQKGSGSGRDGLRWGLDVVPDMATSASYDATSTLDGRRKRCSNRGS